MKNKQIILLVITLVAVAIMMVMVIEPQNEETIQTNQSGIDGTKLKLEELIDDAKYSSGDVSGSYMNKNNEKEYSLKNIVLPEFLFETEAAKKANQEIKALYETLAKEFETELKGEQKNFVETWYDAIRAKGFLSIKITIQRIQNEVEKYEYHTYVFDLDNLELIEFEKLTKKLDVPESELETKVEEGIKNLKEFKKLKEEDLPKGKSIDDYVKATLKNYKEAKKDKSLIYYVDAVGRVNVIIPVELPNVEGDMQRDVKIK